MNNLEQRLAQVKIPAKIKQLANELARVEEEIQKLEERRVALLHEHPGYSNHRKYAAPPLPIEEWYKCHTVHKRLHNELMETRGTEYDRKCEEYKDDFNILEYRLGAR